MNVPAAPGTGAGLNVESYTDKRIQFIITSGDYDLECSSDGITFDTVLGAITASGDLSTDDQTIPNPIRQVRVITNTGGDGAFTLTGRV